MSQDTQASKQPHGILWLVVAGLFCLIYILWVVFISVYSLPGSRFILCPELSAAFSGQEIHLTIEEQMQENEATHLLLRSWKNWALLMLGITFCLRGQRFAKSGFHHSVIINAGIILTIAYLAAVIWVITKSVPVSLFFRLLPNILLPVLLWLLLYELFRKTAKDTAAKHG